MYVNNDPSSEWTATGQPQPSLVSADGAGYDYEEPVPAVAANDLLAFLSDFRSADDVAAPASDEEDYGLEPAWPASGRRSDDASRFAVAPEEPASWDPYQGSEAQVTPDWWMASDGLWYPPELHPDRQVQAAPAPSEPEYATAGPDAAAEEQPMVAARSGAADLKTRVSVGLPRLRRMRQSIATA